MSKVWLVKDKKGRIFGPCNEKEICFYIEEGEFTGEELLSSYPAGQWRPLSAHFVFYEKILQKLNQKPLSSGKNKIEKEQSQSGSSSAAKEEDEPLEPTKIIPQESAPPQKKHKIKLSEKFKEELWLEEGAEDIIEMEDMKGRLFDRLKASLKIPALILAVIAVLFFFLFSQEKETVREERVRLLSVSKKREPISKEEVKKHLQQLMRSYFKGNISDYLSVQSQYVKILEGNPKEAEIYSFLCLIYLEIWPFAYQDTRDKSAFKKTLNLVSRQDTGGIYSGLCKSIQALINKNPEKSLMITNSSLNVLNNMPPIFFYYIKARALAALKRESEARSYLKSIYKLSPSWTAPYMLEAEMFYAKKQYDSAARLYQKALSIFPKHISAGLRMGVLEYKYFKKEQKSESRLKSILLKLDDFAPPNILLEAYIALANIYLKRGRKGRVLEYSNKAYALDPEHPDVLMLKSKLGEAAEFDSAKVKAWGLIYKGDALAAQGSCSEAKDYFRKAFSADGGRNALAALKLAQCHWSLGSSGQAVRWLRRSINADSQMLEAYFLLSDYLSKLYDFDSARAILSAAKSQKPSNYDLFKAYALLSFRQKNYSAAIAYAARSLKFYTADIEIYILLSRAHRLLGDEHKAFSYAEKALMEDVNNIQAQITYALSLDLAYGFHKAKEYFEKLISHFPSIIEYRQALGEYYFNKSMYDKAKVEFQNIIEKSPKFKPPYIYLGRIYSYFSYKKGGREEMYKQALRYFLEANLLDISDPSPLFYTGRAHLEHEQYQAAENEFEKVLNINSNYPLIHYYIGLANFYQQGEENLKKALKFARIQAAKTPERFLPYKLAGDIYKLKSQGAFEDLQEKRVTYELCAREYEKALKYIKNDIEASIGLIECYKGSGNLEAALQLAKQLIRQEGLSGYPELYREIGGIYEAKDQYEKARRYYLSYFTLKPGAKDRRELEARIDRLIKEKQEISSPPKKEE